MAKLHTKDPQLAAQKQAENLIIPHVGKGKIIPSQGSANAHITRLTQFAKYVNKYFGIALKNAEPAHATQYLIDRSVDNQATTIKADRDSIHKMMHHITHKLDYNEETKKGTQLPLTEVREIQNETLKSRHYTNEQVRYLADKTNERNAVSIMVTHESGLRAHELLTLQRLDNASMKESIRAEKTREFGDKKFTGRDNQVKYLVKGKGGLVRVVSLSKETADRLEARRFKEPVDKIDRKILYKGCRYDINGGKSFSNTFSRMSKNYLGWSAGAHGLRHSYVHNRIDEVEKTYSHKDALAIISLELGHFRPEITKVYLR